MESLSPAVHYPFYVHSATWPCLERAQVEDVTLGHPVVAAVAKRQHNIAFVFAFGTLSEPPSFLCFHCATPGGPSGSTCIFSAYLLSRLRARNMRKLILGVPPA